MFASIFSRPLYNLRRFPFTWWLSVLAVAAIAGFVVTSSVGKATAAASRYGGVTTVWVTTHAVPGGTGLTASDVAPQKRPRSFVPPLAILESPIGRTVTSPLDANTVISSTTVGKAGLSPAAALLRRGEQGIAVATGDSGPPLRIGDRVSVIATPSANSDPTMLAVVVTNSARVD